MNQHIELVKKYLADNDSVTIEELRINREAAQAVFGAAAYASYAAAADHADAAAAHYEQAVEHLREYEELAK
jgi:hypothetical protein